MLGIVLGAIWSVVMLPFHVLFWLVEWLGRLTALILGFLTMGVGVALGAAGPLAVIGIPLFVIGLIVTIRSLER